MTLKLAPMDDTWKDYNIAEAGILYNEEPTGYKAIFRDDNLISMVKNGYRLFPNELAVEIGDNISDSMGFEKLDEHYNLRNTRIYATYVANESIAIDNRDKVHLGFAIRNSIDGSMSFGVSGFTFREVCSNGVVMGQRTLAELRQRHTLALKTEVGYIKGVLGRIITETQAVINDFRKLTQLKLNEDIAKRITKRTPKKYIPKYISVEKGELQDFQPVNLWDCYNDISAEIWHADSDIGRRVNQIQELHKIMEIYY